MIFLAVVTETFKLFFQKKKETLFGSYPFSLLLLCFWWYVSKIIFFALGCSTYLLKRLAIAQIDLDTNWNWEIFGVFWFLHLFVVLFVSFIPSETANSCFMTSEVLCYAVFKVFSQYCLFSFFWGIYFFLKILIFVNLLCFCSFCIASYLFQQVCCIEFSFYA